MFARAIATHLGGTIDPDTGDHTTGVIAALRFDADGPTGNVFTLDMPASPDLAVLIKASGGEQVPGLVAVAEPAVQIIARAATLDDVEQLAAEIHSALDCLDNVELAPGTPDAVWVHGITAVQSHPIDMGIDENRRPERSLNFDTSILLATTNRPAA